tara:strand:+ start:177 stop:674 length:498 start_codon:yes stop_codon:yes gene_type:complete
MTLTTFTPEYLDDLIDAAIASPRLRQHRNIHASYQDHCQRFLNAICIESYIRPHRHNIDPKAETLLAVRGLFALVTFDDNGQILDVIRFGTEKYSNNKGLSVGVDISPGIWHTIIALQTGSVLLELKAGPFDPKAAKEPAPWAPVEESVEGKIYLENLRKTIHAN